MSIACHTKYPPLLCPACAVVQLLSHVQFLATAWTAGSSVLHHLQEFAQTHVH